MKLATKIYMLSGAALAVSALCALYQISALKATGGGV